jgi:hypothetical protein
LDLGQIQQLKDQFKNLPATAPSGLPLGKTAH